MPGSEKSDQPVFITFDNRGELSHLHNPPVARLIVWRFGKSDLQRLGWVSYPLFVRRKRKPALLTGRAGFVPAVDGTR